MFEKGYTPWNKDLRGVLSIETRKKMGVKNIGQHRSVKTQFRKGIPSWNKGLPRTWDSPTEFKKGQNASEKHPNWKGDDVGYTALHDWVKGQLGKAFWCTFCFSMVNVQWANISHGYKRDVNDWLQLCVKCHKRYDKGQYTVALLFEKTEHGYGRRIGVRD